MTLPRVLVIDDQYARDAGIRGAFLRQVGSIEFGAGDAKQNAIAEITFSSGQRLEGTRLINDVEVARAAVGGENWSLVLLDLRFDSGVLAVDGRPAGSPDDATFGEEIRRALVREYPRLPVAMLSTSHRGDLPETEVEYFSKEALSPFRMRRKLLEAGTLTREQAAELLGIPPDVIAVADATREVFRKALSFADTEVPVLLLGETGTGKEVVANYLHSNSRRASGPFAAFDLGSTAPNLVEDLIFGHEQGAFDAARKEAKSAFEAAENGTLLLDEIGELSTAVQAKLLRSLETQKFRRLGGGAAERKMNVRLVTATSRSTDVFRRDFLERIGVLVIEIPPLRDRRGDIVPLAHMFLSKVMKLTGHKGIRISDDAERVLEAYDYPGNVRELRNTITRLVALSDNNSLLTREHVAAAFAKATGPAKSPKEVDSQFVSHAEADLGSLEALINSAAVDQADATIEGLLPRLDEAYEALRRRLVVAALQKFRNPLTGELNRQATVQFLFGDRTLKSNSPKRFLNSILGKAQGSDLDDRELEQLIERSRRPDLVPLGEG